MPTLVLLLMGGYGEILLSLREGHGPTEAFVARLRSELPRRFPGIEFFFQPADIVTQILNFGLPAAIDVQFTGADVAGNARLAAALTQAIRQIPGAVDAHAHQRLNAPALNLQMDRTRLQQLGLSASNVGQNVLISLAGSSQTAPAFWLNPQNGVVYNIAVQTPQYQVNSLDALLNMPVGTGGANAAGPDAGGTQLLGNLVEATTGQQVAIASRYNILPAIDVYVSVQGTDLASVGASRRWSIRSAPGCRAAARWSCAARWRRCRRRSSASGSAWPWRSCSSTCSSSSTSSRGSTRSSSLRRCPRPWPASPGCCSSPAPRSACRPSPAPS